MANCNESICRNCFHSYVCEQFNENKDIKNNKCHFFNDHFVPTADVVEVVRCKDCEHWNKTDTDIIVNIDYGKCTNSNSPYHNEEETTGGDYCRYGERKCENGTRKNI